MIFVIENEFRIFQSLRIGLQLLLPVRVDVVDALAFIEMGVLNVAHLTDNSTRLTSRGRLFFLFLRLAVIEIDVGAEADQAKHEQPRNPFEDRECTEILFHDSGLMIRVRGRSALPADAELVQGAASIPPILSYFDIQFQKNFAAEEFFDIDPRQASDLFNHLAAFANQNRFL